MWQTEAAQFSAESAHLLHCVAVTCPCKRLTTNDMGTTGGKSIAISTVRGARVQCPCSLIPLSTPIMGQDPDLSLTGL